MTEKELALYLHRIHAHLRMIYDQIATALPDAEREEIRQRKLKPEIREEIEQRKKSQWIISANNIPKEFDVPENYEEVIEYGRVKVIEPLNDIIDELNNDITLLIGEK